MMWMMMMMNNWMMRGEVVEVVVVLMVVLATVATVLIMGRLMMVVGAGLPRRCPPTASIAGNGGASFVFAGQWLRFGRMLLRLRFGRHGGHPWIGLVG